MSLETSHSYLNFSVSSSLRLPTSSSNSFDSSEKCAKSANQIMESRENTVPSMEPTKPETPSSYQLALRTDTTMGPPGFTPATGGVPASLAKKKRGRPRKYGPDGVAVSGGGSGRILSPLPLSAASSPTSGGGGYSDVVAGSGGEFQTEKKKRKKRMDSSEKLNMGLGDQITSGGSFTPHLVNVNPGEDVTSKIISFSKYGPRAICVLSALGIISHVTLRQANSSGGTVTYEGRFEILSLSGSFTPGEKVEGMSSREGGMSIALSSPDGRVVGGLLAGLLTAAGPVQVVVASFLPEIATTLGSKPKKLKTLKIPNEQNLNVETPAVENDDSTPPPNFHHDTRTSTPPVHDWSSRTSMNLNEQRQKQEETPVVGNDDSTPPHNFHHENRTSMHDWGRTSVNLNEQRQREEGHMVGTENDGSTPGHNSFLNENRNSVANVHDWRRAVTDMNVSFRED